MGVLHTCRPAAGVQAKRNVGITCARNIVYAEGYQSTFPRVTENLA